MSRGLHRRSWLVVAEGCEGGAVDGRSESALIRVEGLGEAETEVFTAIPGCLRSPYDMG